MLYNRGESTYSSLFFFQKGRRKMNKESDFQAALIRKIKERFPGAIVLKNDPNYIQGFPDLTVFWKDKWAVLECKKSEKAAKRPNQEYYVRLTNNMSFGRFVFPENEEDVLSELQHAWQSGGEACLPGSE